MPGTAFPELENSEPCGACKRCSVIVKLDGNGKLAEHRYRMLLVGERCRGSGEDPWEYRA